MIIRKLINNHFKKVSYLASPYTIVMGIFAALIVQLFNVIFLINDELLSFQRILYLCIAVLVILTIACGLYINGLMNQLRRKDWQIYSQVGMNLRQKMQILLVEQVFFWSITTVIMLIFGFFNSKLFFLLFQKIVALPELQFYVSPLPFFITALIMMVIYFILFLFNLLDNNGKKAINIKLKTTFSEKPIRVQLFWSGLGLVLFLYGYYSIDKIQLLFSSALQFLLAVVIIIAGNILIFTYAINIVIHLLQRRKNIYYSKKYFLTLSGLKQKMTQNGQVIVGICLFTTFTFIFLAFSTISYRNTGVIDSIFKHDLLIESRNLKTAKIIDRKVNAKAKQLDLKLSKRQQLILSKPIYGRLEGNKLTTNVNLNFDHLVSFVPLDSFNQSNHTNYKLNKNEVLLYDQNNNFEQKSLRIDGKIVRCKIVNNIKFNPAPQGNITPNLFIVVDSLPKSLDYYKILAYNYHGGKQHLFSKELSFPSDLASRYVLKDESVNLIASFLSCIFFVCITLVVALTILVILLLYCRQLLLVRKQRKVYSLMLKLGVSKDILRQSVRRQDTFIIMLPMIFSSVNSFFLLPIFFKWSDIIGEPNNNVVLSLLAVTFAVYTGFYFICWFLVNNWYNKIIDYWILAEKDI